jgi:hypothetical protein
MILTFLDPNPNPNDPYSSCLFFYAITSLPPRLAEGTILYDALNDQIFGVQTRELSVNTFEEAIEALITSLYTRGLIKAFATHKHNGLTNNLLSNPPEPSASSFVYEQRPLVS